MDWDGYRNSMTRSMSSYAVDCLAIKEIDVTLTDNIYLLLFPRKQYILYED